MFLERTILLHSMGVRLLCLCRHFNKRRTNSQGDFFIIFVSFISTNSNSLSNQCLFTAQRNFELRQPINIDLYNFPI